MQSEGISVILAFNKIVNWERQSTNIRGYCSPMATSTVTDVNSTHEMHLSALWQTMRKLPEGWQPMLLEAASGVTGICSINSISGMH